MSTSLTPLPVEAFQGLILDAEGEMREGTVGTPRRAADAWLDLTCGYQADVQSLFRDFEADGYDEIVALSNIPVYSLCEHHLLPFIGHAAVAYLPDRRIVGLSKLARVVDAYARRLQVQERLTQQIAEAIETYLCPKGTMVVIQARHLCMELRGARTPGALTTTSANHGYLRTKPEARAEAMALMGVV